MRESDLLIGYWNGLNNPILPPEPGNCRILDDNNLEELPKGSLKLIHFTSDRINPEQDANELFFLLSPKDHKPFAIVKLNPYGFASCFISLLSYHISTGYGQYRKEMKVEDNIPNIKVPFPENVFIKIDPTPQNGIIEGDTLRIGRNISEHGISSIVENYNEGRFLIPSKIKDDLYEQGNFTTKSLGVDEYLKSSILIGKNPFEITLEPSSYKFAIFRKNKLICLKSATIKEFEIYELTCPQLIKDEYEFEDESKNYYLDSTFFPFTFIEGKEFQNWLFASSNYFLAAPSFENLDNFYKKEDDTNIKKQFSIVYQNQKSKEVKYLPFTYSAKAASEIKKGSLSELYLGVSGKINSTYITLLRNNLENNYYLGVPLGGAGEENVAKYSVPFSSYTKIINLVPSLNFLNLSNIQATNGALFYLFEPMTLPQNEGLLSSYVQQRFRLRISIPAWNSTNVVEMYINGKIHRRWILDRGDISKPFSKTFEENLSESNAFTVRWVAWGEDFLSNFLTGTNNTLPFAMTRDYCIDTVGDGICHVEANK
ncbi:hypothetical protein AXG55_10195 [Silvanigrella aquatica]|uniref:Uncharacterized protein n=2 Tax=Silvanigrella aquatica TaxID=1915309 RepID=A0A1L4D237_9BACT|nr:hypothetical protein AXG55_10195 [Silvanigrella aquatica]